MTDGRAGLDAVLDGALDLIAEGAADPGSAWRTLALASVAADGAPRARMVVLRRFNRASRVIEVHTDRRSEKVVEYSASPLACMLGWDPARRVQIRLAGNVRIHAGDAVADEAWGRLRPGTLATYHARPGPGTRLSRPQDADQGANEASAREAFTVLQVSLHEIEWLHLAEAGHRRAVFRWAHGMPEAMWLAP